MNIIKPRHLLVLLVVVLTLSMVVTPYNNQVILVDAVDGDAWLSGYGYREKLNFWEETGAGTGYACDIMVKYASGTDAARLVYTDGNSRTDFGDIRFTDYTGNVELEYWMQEKVNSDWARFWFKMTDDLGAYGRAYIYYGKADATYDGDGSGVFIEFDDFEDGTLDNWDTVTNMEIKTDRKYGSYSAGVINTGEGALITWDTVTITTPIAICFSQNADNILRGGAILPFTQNDESEWGGYVRPGYEAGTSKLYYYDGTYRAFGSSDDDITSDTWWEYEYWIDFDPSDPDMKCWHHDSWPLNYDGEEDWHEADDTDPEALQLERLRFGTQYNYPDWFDNIFIRPVVYTGEPYVFTVSPEETAPITNIDFDVINADSPDSKHFYAEKREYIITTNTTILSGYEDIDAVRVFLESDTPETIFTLRYYQDTDTFLKDSGTVTLVTGSCEAVGSGIYLDLTFAFTVPWSHSQFSGLHFRMVSTSDWDIHDETDDIGDFDIETRLDILDYGLDDGSGTSARGDYNSEDSITSEGTVVYFGGSVNPPSDEVDVWVSCADIAGTPWSDLTLTDGLFSMTVDSDDVVGSDTYTIKVVQEGIGSGGTDECIHSHTPTYVADYMIFIATVSETWVMVDETITVTLSAKYAYPDGNDDVPSPVWSNVDSGEVSYDTTGERDWYIVSTGDTHGITSITNTSASCLWDDILMSSLPAYKWTQYSHNEVWLIIDTAKFTWYGNSSNAYLVRIQSLINGTEDDWGIINSDGYIGDLVLGGNPTTNAFDMSWHYANISLEAKITGHDRIIWTRILKVDILHSIQIVDSGFYLTDDWVIITIQINWNNGTFFVWDNVTGTPVLVGASYMGSYPFARSSVIGQHTLIVLVNGTHGTLDSSAQVPDGVDTDSWEYLEFPYTINPVTFSITELLMMQNNESIIVSGFWHTPNTTMTWEVYEAGIFVDSGVLTIITSGEYNSIRWNKNEPTMFNNFTLSITADGSVIRLHSFSYVLDSASYLTTVSGSSLVIYEGDTYFDESTTEEGLSVEEFRDIIIVITALIFLSVFLGGIYMWWEKRKEKQADFRAMLGS